VSRKKLKTIGVLGGMGPESGAYFIEQITRACLAERDQDHPPVVLYSLPQVPDRTEAILRGGPSPVPALRRGLATLHRAGADFAVISCISAHYFLPRIAPRSPLPVLDLVETTLAAVRALEPRPGAIGLIATTGTVRSGLVSGPFKGAGFRIIVPPARGQARVMAAIYGKKGIKAGVTAGPPWEALLDVALELVQAGAGAILAGCTEVPLALRPGDLPVPLLDPMVLGAREAVRRSGARLRPS
jgi:aspartate racemase